MAAIASGLLLCAAVRAQAEIWLELGTGYDTSADVGPKGPQGVFRLRYEIGKNDWWKPDVVEFTHYSNLIAGPPFRDDQEDVSDQASLIWRFRLR